MAVITVKGLQPVLINGFYKGHLGSDRKLAVEYLPYLKMVKGSKEY